MPTHTDQLNRKVTVTEYPKRIISLVPSQTELLVDLGLRDELVGITKFCIHPKGLKKEKQIIGGTKNFHFDKIDALQPDLIIGNKEENYQEGIEKLAEKYPVWMSDIFTIEDAVEMIENIGELTNKVAESKNISNQIKIDFKNPFSKKGTAIYLIWNDPIMTVGSNTFINEMLAFAGFENLVQEKRYPKIDLEVLKNLNPEFLLLSSEPFPYKEKHVAFYQKELPNTQVKIVDGELFSWYGSTLLKSKDYFLSLNQKFLKNEAS
ncbi:ABC transporter substrate-binding protein [Belliella aquatica]|uniref:Iron ABC transporter n=1 Tax=Belliella aquatica TaxID=1323734 RepID=A0ABQ1MPN3_9BACT|nr:helical backbone metal receptor [Belliella aquatica]MCH7406218.1 helical backbone metal receptor [Belliella aquatica]GGC44324.1 iron ABC transporter [Belliella aquatica]